MSVQRWSIVILILLLGALVRALHIGAHSFWIDEGFSFFFAYSPDFVATLASDVHPPLYFAALRLSSDLTGHSEVALRWFSLLPSMLSLALVFQLAKEAALARSAGRAGKAVPYVAMLLLALADAESFLAQEARHYTWLSLLALCAMLFLARWLRRSRRADFSAWFAASTLMLYTHYIAAFALAAQGLYILVWTRGKTRTQALSTLLLSALTLAPWLIAVGAQQLGNRDSYKVWSLELTMPVLQDIGVQYFSGQWALMIGLVALGCVSLVYRRDSSVALRFDRFTPLLLLWLLLPFGLTLLVNEFLPFLEPRRLILWTPAIALLAALGLGNVRGPVRALLIAVLVVYGVTQVDWHRGQPDWRRIAALTTRYAVAGDLILTDVASGDYALRYYLLRNQGASLADGVRYEALQFQREYAAAGYEAWLPALLDEQETVWLMYWSSDLSAFNWLNELGFKRSADFVHIHDGGAHGDTFMHVFRFDRAPEGEPAARFSNGMILRSAKLDAADLRLDMLWESERPPARDFTLSAKLLDASGVVVAQHDGTPQMGQRPTSGWEVGELIYSAHELEALKPIAVGDYRLIVQIYTMSGDGFANVLTENGMEYALVGEVNLGADA